MKKVALLGLGPHYGDEIMYHFRKKVEGAVLDSAQALLTLLAYAEQDGIASKYEFKFFLFNQSHKFEDILSEIEEWAPDIVAMSHYVWNIKQTHFICKNLTGPKIIVGGPNVEAIEHKLLDKFPNIDIIVTGEGEITFTEILKYYDGQLELKDIRGITYQGMKGPIEPRGIMNVMLKGSLNSALNDIPAIAPLVKKYTPDISFMTIETSRGCPMSCSYCQWGDTQMQFYSEDRVFKEIEELAELENLRILYICDSNFLLHKTRAIKILDHLIENIDIKNIMIFFDYGYEQMNKELLERLAQLNQLYLNWSIQTLGEKALELSHRKFNVEKFEKALELSHSLNITYQNQVELIVGLPGDTIDDMIYTVNTLVEYDFDLLWFYPLQILGGTELGEYGTEHELVGDEWTGIIQSTKNWPAEEMDKFKEYAYYIEITLRHKPILKKLREVAKIKQIKFTDLALPFMKYIREIGLVPKELGWYRITAVTQEFERNRRIDKAVRKNFNQIEGEWDKWISNYI